MRAILLSVVLCTGCCLSAKTKILSRKIAFSAQSHHQEMLDLKKVTPKDGETIFDTKEWKTAVKRAAKIGQVTSGLADLLGAPKTLPKPKEGE